MDRLFIKHKDKYWSLRNDLQKGKKSTELYVNPICHGFLAHDSGMGWGGPNVNELLGLDSMKKKSCHFDLMIWFG